MAQCTINMRLDKTSTRFATEAQRLLVALSGRSKWADCSVGGATTVGYRVTEGRGRGREGTVRASIETLQTVRLLPSYH